ncbi:amidohydrolase family protein [Chloroflexota bacterium]
MSLLASTCIPIQTPPTSPAPVPKINTPDTNQPSVPEISTPIEQGDTTFEANDVSLPSPGFIVEQTRSDPNRTVREYREEYGGPLADTHVHLDPPVSGDINEVFLVEMIKSIDSAGVDSIIVMPVPNEGIMIMLNNTLGTKQREMLRHLAVGKIEVNVFYGSEYISNWLHNVYRNGYSESELNEVLGRLLREMDDIECSGVGEIGLYHFNKTGRQNVIEYPPTFEPFLTIVSLVTERGIWLDLHAEPVDPSGTSYEDQVFGGLELLYRKYPDLKLIMSHTAMTNPKNVRWILTTYPNVMMNFKSIGNHNKWRNLEPITNPQLRLYEDWAQLFEEMPDRFMVGTDEKFGRARERGAEPQISDLARYEEGINTIRKILGSLNPDAAELIAYKNAERVLK